jgi:mannose-6-phosphate isomerase-like protein (cupin superfamily)
MKHYINNIETETVQNNYFRKVLFTGKNSQLVVMSLLPKEEIGMEVHNVDQFIRIEEGEGKAVLDGEEFDLADDFAIVIPAGMQHNIVNTSDSRSMKIYSVYSPPEHPAGTIDETKEDAIKREGH